MISYAMKFGKYAMKKGFNFIFLHGIGEHVRDEQVCRDATSSTKVKGMSGFVSTLHYLGIHFSLIYIGFNYVVL